MKETLEAWQEIKDYVISIRKDLQPLIKKVDDTLNAMEELMRINYFNDLMEITYNFDNNPLDLEHLFLVVGKQKISISEKNEPTLSRLLNARFFKKD